MPDFKRLITRLQAFVVLQEADRPLSIDELAAQILDRGGHLPCGMESLRKALSRGPYRKSLTGLYSLDREHYDFWYDEVRTRHDPTRQPEPPMVPDLDFNLDEALTPQELEEFRPPHLFSFRKKLVCSLDAFGSFSLEAPPQALLPPRLERVEVQRSLAGRELPLTLEGSQLVLRPHHPELRQVRGQVREILVKERTRQAEAQKLAARRQDWLRQEAERKQAAWTAFASSRRALVRLFFHDGGVAGSLLNLADNTFSDFTVDRGSELRDALNSMDILFGLDPHTDCERLGIETTARLVDLTPPFKSRKVNQARRTVHFDDLSAQLRMTVNASQPLGNPQKLADYWAKSQWTKFFRRLQSDLKSLYQYYRYGVEHGYVRLRWGFREEETVPVSWNLGNEPTVYDLIRDAMAAQSCVEVVLSSTPGFEDRFARAIPFWPTDIGLGWVSGRFSSSYGADRVPFPEITAIRGCADTAHPG
ncbi:hypothetical protein IV102_05720 [bacterium]|nr:hypothetical protein [bacterium]